MKKLEVFICDLTHDGARIANEHIPLGVGFIASHARMMLGDQINLRLIKYPKDMLEQLNRIKPDVVAFANYVWNNELNEWFCAKIKKTYPDTITVKGGPNFPTHLKEQKSYLQRHAATDAYIPHEGEIAFEGFLRAVIERGKSWRDAHIPGVTFLSPASAQKINPLLDKAADVIMAGVSIPRIRDLDTVVPSPYLNGLLDPFFDGKLTPVIQRTRGCPFTCNFCNEGDPYYSKINKFSTERMIAELHYIGERATKYGIRSLIITDMNFGMYTEDLVISREIKNCQAQYGWPLNVIATTGKNRIDHVAEVFKNLGDTVLISMSMQSMNESVLQTIKRQNIKPEMYLQLTNHLSEQPKLAELILPLPNETLKSYFDSNKFLINASVDKIVNYTLQINNGTAYDSPDYLRLHGYKTYFRAYANCFGIYDGETVMEAEEVAISTNTISEDDYFLIRKFAFIIELIYNNSIFIEFFRLLRNYGIEPYEFVYYCFEHTSTSGAEIEKACIDFLAETRAELYSTPEELRKFFRQPANYKRLVAGDLGRNVMFSNKAIVLATMLGSLVDFVAKNFYGYVANNKLDISAHEISDLARFAKCKLDGMLTVGAANKLQASFVHDVPRWLEAGTGPLMNFASDKPIDLVFYFDDKQQNERADNFSRLGSDVLGCMKILARVPNHHKPIRKVCYLNTPHDAGQLAKPTV